VKLFFSHLTRSNSKKFTGTTGVATFIAILLPSPPQTSHARRASPVPPTTRGRTVRAARHPKVSSRTALPGHPSRRRPRTILDACKRAHARALDGVLSTEEETSLDSFLFLSSNAKVFASATRATAPTYSPISVNALKSRRNAAGGHSCIDSSMIQGSLLGLTIVVPRYRYLVLEESAVTVSAGFTA
jgi:hypothetical protein